MIIGISGKLGSGKSTVAKLVADFLGWETWSFGRAVKLGTATQYGFEAELCFTQEGKLTMIDTPVVIGEFGVAKSVRELLQHFGTDLTRARDADYWVKKCPLDKDLVIDDVRFPNEAQFCLDNGFCFRIEHFGSPNDSHASEVALDDYQLFDLVLTPGFGQLRQSALRVLQMLGHHRVF